MLHDTLFDWEDESITADSITVRLIGRVNYYARPEFSGMLPHEVERKILFEGKRPNWGGGSRYGKPYYQHMLALIGELFVDTDITPSLADAVMFFCMGLGGANKKILNLIGSTNSGKSAASCRIAFACMYIDPHYTAVYVASPFDIASDATVWGDVEELWDQLVERFPNQTGTGYGDAPSLFPWGKKYARRLLEFIPGLPKAGIIELKGVKHVGKFKGSKTRGKDVDRGLLMVVIDEVNEVENFAFLTTLTNISSQEAFFCVTSQNFKEPEDMGGRLSEPTGTFGGPSSFDDLDIERDLFWHSAASSITLRFDGHRSPNILSKRTIYRKLFDQKTRQRLKDDYGEQSPHYFSQARSFPIRGDETNSVLSRAKISSSRHDDAFFSMLRLAGGVSFCDPAFGGRDKAVWGCAHFGPASVTDGEGNQNTEELLLFREKFHTLPLVKGAIYPGDPRSPDTANYWKDRMRAVGIETKDFVEGSELSYEQQIAIQCAELNKRHGIPAANFGYDFSMRPDIVSAVNQIIGFGACAFDYNQGPEGVYLQSLKQNSEDCCKNRCTELAFLAADYFLTKQVRGGGWIENAITQLSRTQYTTVNKKYVAEGKKEYKARWQQVSPDHRDVLMGIAAMAHRRGFRQATVAQGNSKSIWSQINDRNVGKSKVAKRL